MIIPLLLLALQGEGYTPQGTYDSTIPVVFEDETLDNGTATNEGYDSTIKTDGHDTESEVDSQGNY